MTPGDEMGPAEVEDLRPPDYWGRHILAKVVLFSALGVGIAGARLVGGDGGTFLMGVGGVVVAPFMLVGAVELMRGRVSPLPGRDWKLLSPIACFAWGLAFLVMSSAAIGAVALDLNEGERPGWFLALACAAGALAIVGVMIQIGSLSDQWPDKWRPPYARQQSEQVEERPAGGSESAEPSRSDERP